MTSTKSKSSKFKVVGTRPIRHDGVDKVTGKAQYSADIHLPGLLAGVVVRSPYAHAKIKSIDTSAAKAHPDVRAIVTYEDLAPFDPVGRTVPIGFTVNENIFAAKKALYKGHPIVAIAATSLDAAEEAAALIKIDYEPLTPITNVEEALADGAPIIHDHWTKSDDPQVSGNIAIHEQYNLGDIEKGFSDADQIFEQEYTTKRVHQGYIEPHSATAWWTPEGKVTIWASSQGQFQIRDNTARIIGTTISKVKVIPMEIGGGFGGKLYAYLEPIAAVLAKKASVPVKLTMSRTEGFESTGPAGGSKVIIKVGVDKTGKITAAHGIYYIEGGAYPGAPIPQAAAAIFSPYYLENVRIDGFDVITNTPRTAAYRAPGAPIVGFATESLMDEIATALKIDPVKFRITNVAKNQTRRADGVMNGVIGAQEVMESIQSHDHYAKPVEQISGAYTGRGVSMGFCRNGTGMSSVTANVLDDGTVSLIEGSIDIGGSRTAVAQQFAEVLGIPVEDVNPQVGDTDAVGFTSSTGGSGVAFKTGLAAIAAAEDIIKQLVARAALLWETTSDKVEYTDGVATHKDDPKLNLTFKQLIGKSGQTGGPIVGRSNIDPVGHGPSYSANIVDIAVDKETGKVSILRYTAFQDVGTAVHPTYVEGQIQGGTTQGIGWALNEAYYVNAEGAMLNASFLDYRMPTSLNLPMIETVMVEVPNPNHPFGVRGVGEANIAPPLAALANAISAATGSRLRDLPMTPENIRLATENS